MPAVLICGVDEAGRGPLAGPVTAAAVILSPDFPIAILGDSKKLGAGQREDASRLIRARARAWAVGWAWPEEIDRLNILQASLLAMERSLRQLALRPDQVLVDGLFVPPSRIPCTPIVKGDERIPEIMAASIIAKTTRDRWMARYGRIEPGYLFERHKGYPTAEHRAILASLGASAIHRRSFRCRSCG